MNAPGLNGQTDLQILLVQVGERTFGLPLGEVRYVAAMPSGFVSHGPNAQANFLFENDPLPYQSLWDSLSLPSLYDDYEEMHGLLPQRRQDHIDWMGSLEDAIRTNTPFTKARNPRDCAFGKWYYAYQAKDRNLDRLMGQFERPHAQIHMLADRLLDLAATGEASEALRQLEAARNTTLGDLLKLFDEAQRLSLELQRRIVVITSDGDSTAALGADRIRDVADIPAERIRQDRRQAGSRNAATAGLIILDNQEVVPLLDWRSVCGLVAV